MALKAAVIGVGHLGQHHARIYSQLEGVDLVGVVDPRPDQGREVARRVGSQWFQSLDDLFAFTDSLDIASVVVPTVAHFEVAQKLLNKKVHLLIEKPVTASLEQAQELERLADEKGAIVAVGHVEQFNPPMRELRGLAPQPLLIRTRREGLYTGRIADVGVVLDLMIHDLELICSLINAPVASIQASRQAFHCENEDTAMAQLTFANGANAQLFCSRVSHHKNRVMEVICEDKTYELDLGAGTLTLWHAKHDPVTGLQQGTSRQVTLEAAEPLKAEIEHFIDCVRHGKRPLVALEDGTRALSLALKILDCSNK